MLGRSVTFGPKSVEKRPQQGNFFELTTPIVGYRLNRLDEPVFMAVSKPLLTEFGIHHRLESCVTNIHNITHVYIKNL